MPFGKKMFVVLFGVIVLGGVTVLTLSAHLATMLSGEGQEKPSSATPCYRENGKIVCK